MQKEKKPPSTTRSLLSGVICLMDREKQTLPKTKEQKKKNKIKIKK